MKKILLVLMLSTLLGCQMASVKDELNCSAPMSAIKSAHKYHGILISTCDESGYYFIRDGVRCKLFTESWTKLSCGE